MRRLEAFRLAIPFRRAMATASGTVTVRESILVAVHDGDAVGWGEAAPWPGQTLDDIDSAWRSASSRRALEVANGWMAPGAASPSVGAAVEEALAALAATEAGRPLWAHFGGRSDAIPAAAAVGMAPSLDALEAEVAGLVGRGYRAIKLKVGPGRDVEPLRAVRRAFPDLQVGVDANGSYEPGDAALTDLAALGPTYIEQPHAAGAEVATAALRDQIDVPIVLDESLRGDADVTRLIELGAADALTIKPGRIGVTAARTMHRLAGEAGMATKVSGLFETSVGKAHSLAFATLPGVAYVDFAPTNEHLRGDVVVDPWEIEGGMVTPRPSPGLGVTVDPARVDDHAVAAVHLDR